MDAPFNNQGNSVIYASFTINVTQLPTFSAYFADLQDTNGNSVAHVFITRNGTKVPGTYRLGVDNFENSSSYASYYPLDLATNTTYDVVFNYDGGNLYATLAVNPVTSDDFANSPSYGADNAPSAGQQTINISEIAFSQYVGIEEIGNVIVGSSFADVFPYVPAAPVIGIQPANVSAYSGSSGTFYTAASGLGNLSYQWYSNNVALVDDGVNVIGSETNILTIENLQNTATYSVVVSNSAGATTSQPATAFVTNTLTAPFFTSQPSGATNGLGSSVTLSATANGTGPITYQWYFEETNTSTFVPVGTGSNVLTLANLDFTKSGSYYVTAAGPGGSLNSATIILQVIPPPLVTIAFLHSLLASNNVPNTTNLNNGAIYSIKGVVTSFGQLLSKTYSEYFVQDDTGAALAFINGTGSTNSPPVGTMVEITGPAQQYYGELELDPNVTSASNNIAIISSNNPLPAPLPLNLALMATNTMGDYGRSVQCSLVTLTNVYLYSSSKGAAVSGNFPVNSTKALYAFSQPYAAGLPYMEIYVVTYTNVNNPQNAAYWNQPIPSFAYQVTGAMGIYSTNTPEIYPSRFADFVTTPPAPFSVSVSATNNVPTVTWPAVPGSTYSLYTSTNVAGPWNRTFGLSYYPSLGSYTVTNPAPVQFYHVSTP